MSSPIAIAPNLSEYFHEVLTGAIRARNVAATEAASTYLVSLLEGYAHPDERAGSCFNEPLTFLLRDALEASGADRFKRLRVLGDHVLYAVGFFGGYIELKGADRRYVIGVGSTAYANASAMLRLRGKEAPAEPSVLSELASKFASFSDVLRDVAEGTLALGAKSERSIVKLYERWLKTGSALLASELGAQGIVPSRGAGGLN